MVPYIIKSFRGGVSDESDKGVEGSFKFGYGLEIHERDDVLKCNSTMATIDESVVTDLIKWFVPASDGSTYAFGNSGKVYSIAGDIYDPVVSLKYTDSNGDIRGAIEFEDSNGNNYLFWATATAIAQKRLPGDDAWGDVTPAYKTEGVGNWPWHTMALAAGAVMVANGDSLMMLDYDMNFDQNAVNIRPGNVIKALEERDDYVIMGSYREDESENGHLWSWITTADNYVEKKRIPIKGINALVFGEIPLLQGGEEGELFLADFQNPVPLHGIPLRGQVNPGGVSLYDDMAIFGVFGGSYPGLWSYGRKRKNRPLALNFEYKLSKDIGGSTISSVGAVAVIKGLPLVSWGTTDGSTSDYGIDMLSNSACASAIYESLEFDAGQPHMEKKFDSVHLLMSPMPSSTSVSVRYKQNKLTTGGDSSAGAGWKYAFTSDGGTSFSVTDATEALFTISAGANTYEVAVDLTPSGSSTPEVTNIVTYIADASYEYA